MLYMHRVPCSFLPLKWGIANPEATQATLDISKLPDDYYAVFKSITRVSWANKSKKRRARFL